ncbi:hypothetical protein FQA47_015300 [Oryzias melastigma]|uniref:Uncharacterized protein n=1 Tax=Oryzias melastigma TaxID=30732 RepID=A0A834FG16_ORYME|nr:hypothetical protein FQA47_015300 [Oryzias melastigma]
MGPRKRGARKRKSEDALVEEDSKNTERKAEEEEGDAGRRRKKFIGAHVGIQEFTEIRRQCKQTAAVPALHPLTGLPGGTWLRLKGRAVAFVSGC